MLCVLFRFCKRYTDLLREDRFSILSYFFDFRKLSEILHNKSKKIIVHLNKMTKMAEKLLAQPYMSWYYRGVRSPIYPNKQHSARRRIWINSVRL